MLNAPLVAPEDLDFVAEETAARSLGPFGEHLMVSDDVRFRPATLDDRATLLGLCSDYRAADGQPAAVGEVRAAIDSALLGDPLVHIFLIESDGAAERRTLGYMALTIGFSIEVGGRDSFVDELYVEAHARGRGIGSQALAFAERTLTALGVRRVCLEVERDNPNAQRLYVRRGFVAHTRSLMSKRLVPPP